jgi:hypothetical protein
MYYKHKALAYSMSISLNYIDELLKVGSALCDIIVLCVGKEQLKPLDEWHIRSVHL